jgi:hypothetical protein
MYGTDTSLCPAGCTTGGGPALAVCAKAPRSRASCTKDPDDPSSVSQPVHVKRDLDPDLDSEARD